MDDVGKLVMLDYLLTGTRFDQYSGALPVADREPARRQLDNQRDSLREQVLGLAAAGVRHRRRDRRPARRTVPDGHIFVTLARRLRPAQAAAANFRGAVDDVLGGALDARYPGHPKFDRRDDEVRRAELTAVLDLARRAMAGGGRVEAVDRPTATKVRRVVDGFGVGQLREIIYVLAPQYFRWHDEFTRATAGGDVTVGAPADGVDDYGMTTDEQDLLILAWAALTDRSGAALRRPAAARPSAGWRPT